jgi:hypothetical protein
MEPGNRLLGYGCGIVALGLPGYNQTLCPNHEDEIFPNVHGDHFHFSLERIPSSRPNV